MRRPNLAVWKATPGCLTINVVCTINHNRNKYFTLKLIYEKSSNSLKDPIEKFLSTKFLAPSVVFIIVIELFVNLRIFETFKN